MNMKPTRAEAHASLLQEVEFVKKESDENKSGLERMHNQVENLKSVEAESKDAAKRRRILSQITIPSTVGMPGERLPSLKMTPCIATVSRVVDDVTLRNAIDQLDACLLKWEEVACNEKQEGKEDSGHFKAIAKIGFEDRSNPNPNPNPTPNLRFTSTTSPKSRKNSRQSASFRDKEHF